MKVNNQEQLQLKLLGYFTINSTLSGCLIVDWLYSVESLDYPSGDEEYPQLILPKEFDWYPCVPQKYNELGYLTIGVNPSVELGLELRGLEFVDIPVYALGKGERHQSIFIEIHQWVETLEIEEGEEEQYINPQIEETNWQETTQALSRKFFGYTTAIGGGILICDMDFVRMCQNYHDNINAQIIVPVIDSVKGFRAGVVADIPEDLRDREFPVYGEYEGDTLKRITIEIANLN
jgi:hypothetical protein